MEHVGTQLSWSQSEARQAVDDCDAKAEAEASKQRRKVQNRKNQRAHRLRLKSRGSGNVQESRPFQVRRWRLDEPDHSPSHEISLASELSLLPPHTYTAISPSTANFQRPVNFHLLPFSFPLSSDHLLHLIQYNVGRAIISNMRTLNTLPVDSTICTIASRCSDNTTLYPLKADIPPSLIPTAFQQTHDHSTWINVIPFPRVRENLIRYEGSFDPWELLQDLVGNLFNTTTDPRHRDAPASVKVPRTPQPLTVLSGSDPDEVTAGRKGLIVWGEPHEMKNWEATPGFLVKWARIVQGCDELVEISNHWRMKRGEKPMRLVVSRSYPPPPLSHAASSGG